jgi:signal transduction histidine kinase
MPDDDVHLQPRPGHEPGTAEVQGGSPVEGESDEAHHARLAQAGRLLADVVHEIKNPLAVIQGYAQLLQEKITDEEDRRDLQCIVDETRRVSGLVDDMLAFTRRAPEVAEDVDLGHVISSAVSLSMHGMHSADISVVASVPDGPVVVRGAHGSYVQVLLNLLANARQSLVEGRSQGRGISIRIDESETGPVTLIVANNGPPIPPEIADAIFDPFFTTKSRQEGTGLGLAVCRDILTRYGGSIRLQQDERAGGVTFRLELPRAKA